MTKLEQHKTIILQALNAQITGDATAARHKFSRYTPDEMKELYGESGDSRQEVLNAYIKQEQAIKAAIAWVTNLKAPS